MDLQRLIALVPAAGAGSRLGGPKALHPLGDRTFLGHIAATCAEVGVGGGIVVVGAAAAQVAATAPAGWHVVENPSWATSSMIDSIRLGLPDPLPEGLLLWPVDVPVVAPETVLALAAALRGNDHVAVPTSDGRRGHPILLGRAMAALLRTPVADAGARALLAAHPQRVVEVPVADPGALVDVDVPADLDRLPRR